MEEKNDNNQQIKESNCKDLVSSLILIAFCIYVIIKSLRMKVYNTFYDAPGIFPFVIASIICLCSIFLFISSLKKVNFQDLKLLWERRKNILNNIILKRVIIITGMIILYGFFLVQHMHFAIATFILLSVMMFYLKIRLLILILVSAGLSLSISYAFGTLFNIPLP